MLLLPIQYPNILLIHTQVHCQRMRTCYDLIQSEEIGIAPVTDELITENNDVSSTEVDKCYRDWARREHSNYNQRHVEWKNIRKNFRICSRLDLKTKI